MSGLPQGSLILVTGGTGTVGSSIVRRLLEFGYRVRVFARGAGRGAPPGAEAAPGDIRDRAVLAAAAAGAEAVVHAVGILRESLGQTFEAVHVLGTRNAVEAARAAGARRFIHIGGVGASLSGRDPLSRNKARAEEEVRRGGLDYTVLRASFVFGVKGSVLDRIERSLYLTRPVVVLPCGGRGLFQPLWIEDLAACVLACLWDGRGVGETYELGGPEAWSYKDLVLLLKRRERLRRLLVSLPSPLLLLAAAAPRLLGREPLLTATEMRQLCMDVRTDPMLLPREFGISPVRLEDVLGPR